MANLIGAAYKWRIDNNVYSYITNTEGGEPFIVSGSTECNEELIRNKVQNFTKDQYKTKFQEMVSAVHAYNNGKYSYIQFLDYTIYMNEAEHCDIYNRPDVVTDVDFTVCATTLPCDSEATVGIYTTDEDIECREGEKIRKYHIDFGIPKGSRFIPIKVTDEELLQNGEQIIRENNILAGDFVVSVDSNTIWSCDKDYQFINSGVQLNAIAYRYFADINAYSFGENDIAKGVNSITEGYATVAGYEGSSNQIEDIGEDIAGYYSHAEGNATAAAGSASHAEGKKTYASGIASHAEGNYTIAYGFASHTEGEYTITHNSGEHAEGRYNLSNHDSIDRTEYATISSIGIGSDDNNRANAVEVMLNGDVYIKGIGGYDGTNPSDSETKTLQDVINSGNNTNTDYLPLSGGNMKSTINFPWGDEDTTPYITFNGGSIKPYSTYGVSINGDDTHLNITNGLVETDGYVQALGFYDTSDIRKKDVQGELSLDKAYDFIRNCEPILYNLKGSDRTQIGLIAQEVREFFPEIVNEDKEGYLSLDYSRLTVIILRVLKDLIDKK